MLLIAPMLAKTGTLPKDDDHYGYEIKWDGIRAIVHISQGRVKVISRNLRDITNQYPELAKLGETSASRSLILDGEIVAFAADGRPSFASLQHRMGLASSKRITIMMEKVPVTLVIFDLLQVDDTSMLKQPYTERRRRLQELALTGPCWQTPGYTIGQGAEMLATSRSLGLEGIIAKKLDSLYLPGKRPGTWLKIKNQQRQELVIGGWVPGQGAREGQIGALLVGYYDTVKDKRKFQYAGAVGTGFTRKSLAHLIALLEPLKIDDNPFSERPPQKEAYFVQPKLVGEFEFTEWTPNDTLRHPSFKGLRNDKQPEDVVRET